MAYKNFIKGVVLFLFFVLFKSVILFAATSPNLIPVTVLNVIDGDTITIFAYRYAVTPSFFSWKRVIQRKGMPPQRPAPRARRYLTGIRC